MIQFQKPKKKQIKGYIIKGGIMKVKELIKLLQQAPQDIDVDVFNHDTDYLQKIDGVWIPNKQDMKDNPEVQLEINKGK